MDHRRRDHDHAQSDCCSGRQDGRDTGGVGKHQTDDTKDLLTAQSGQEGEDSLVPTRARLGAGASPPPSVYITTSGDSTPAGRIRRGNRDYGSQLDHLGVAESVTQVRDHFVGHLWRCLSHSDGVPDGCPLRFAVYGRPLPVGDLTQLDRVNPAVERGPETEVQAPAAADFGRRRQLGQGLNSWVEGVPAGHPIFVRHHGAEHLAVVQQSKAWLQHRTVAALAVDLRNPKQWRWFVIKAECATCVASSAVGQNLASNRRRGTSRRDISSAADGAIRVTLRSLWRQAHDLDH